MNIKAFSVEPPGWVLDKTFAILGGLHVSTQKMKRFSVEPLTGDFVGNLSQMVHVVFWVEFSKKGKSGTFIKGSTMSHT